MTAPSAQILTHEDCLTAAAEEDHAYKAKIAALADKRGRYVVMLASAGNPDFGQDPSRSVPGVRKVTVRVATLRNASLACRLYIAHHDLGGGNWVGGEVRDHMTKTVVAQISYNGRAWQPGAWPQPEIVVLPPAERAACGGDVDAHRRRYSRWKEIT